MVKIADLPDVASVPTAPADPVARRKPPQRPKMTKASVEAAKPEAARYDLKDHEVTGLRLTVFPSGVKTWSLRYTVAAKGGFADQRLTIGKYSDALGLAEARRIAAAAKLNVVKGGNPAAEKAEARRIAAAGIVEGAMFATAWTEWQNAPKPKSRNKKGWRPSTAKRAERLYKTRLEKKWGKRRLDEITKADVSSLLDGIAVKHPQSAARIHRVLASFFNWCVAKGRLAKSPCEGIESAKRNKRKRKLTDAELRWLWLACEKEPFPMGYFVRLLILTLARRNEVAAICARELHTGNRRTWIIPAERTKNHHEHEIFLTDAMLQVIKAVPRVKNKAGYLFTTNGKTPFSGFSKAKKRLDALMLERAKAEDPEVAEIQNWTLHDLRRTGSTRMQRLGFENEVIDACLNHIDDDEYLQDDFEAQKVKAFDAWSREVLRVVALTS